MEHPLIQIAKILVAEMREQDGLDYQVEMMDIEGVEHIVLMLDGQPVKGIDDKPIAFLPGSEQEFLIATFEYVQS